MGNTRPLFSLFYIFNTVHIKQILDKSLPIAWFELRISGVRGNRSTNWATTTAFDTATYPEDEFNVMK